MTPDPPLHPRPYLSSPRAGAGNNRRRQACSRLFLCAGQSLLRFQDLGSLGAELLQ